eukprot:7723650-Karenia_brevis.AAC.1
MDMISWESEGDQNQYGHIDTQEERDKRKLRSERDQVQCSHFDIQKVSEIGKWASTCDQIQCSQRAVRTGSAMTIGDSD